MENKAPLLKAENICKVFKTKNGNVRALNNVSLEIFKDRTCALVGESGSGKSTLANILLGLMAPDSGKIFFNRKDTAKFSRREKNEFRRSAQIIFQNPYESLDRMMRIKDIIEEVLVIHRIGKNKEERKRLVDEMRMLTGLDTSLMERRPDELSGGQRQRVSIASAMILRPEFLICDECTSALDALVQAQILNLLKDFRKNLGLTCLFISHNIEAVSCMADEIAVMKDGCIVEQGPAEEILNSPKHEYTKKLLQQR